MKGWIKLHRKLQEHWIWNEKRKFSKFEAWIYILFQANHKDNKAMINGQLVDVNKGELITSELSLSEKWNWDRKSVRKFLITLENEKMITKKATSKYTSVTVENWSLYQNEEQQNEQQNEQQMNTDKNDTLTQKEISKYTSITIGNSDLHQNKGQPKGQQKNNRKDNKRDTDKNDKNVKNDKNIYIPASEEKSSPASAKANKHKYGEYKNVLLKDKELQSLKGEYENWNELITYLDEYIEMKGYKAKSHYLCIKKWVVDAVKRENNKQMTRNTNSKDTDWLKEELENEN